MKSSIHKNTTNKAYIAFLFPLLLAYQSCKKSEKGGETIQSEKIEMKLMLNQDVSQKLKNVPGEKSGIITARLITGRIITGRIITARAPFFPKSITEITFPVKLSEENGVFFVSFELPPSEGEWELSITFYVTKDNKEIPIFKVENIKFSVKPGDKIEREEIEVEEVDDDGDKFSNLQELIDGTDPQDYTSCISTAVFYKDTDKDGYTDGTTRVACATAQIEGFGMNLKAGDCDDNNANIHPGAPLVCGNSTDEDCDGNVEAWAYTDSDGDGYAPDSTSSCVNTVSFPGQITAGFELGTNDCDDNNPSANPGMPEILDTVSDNNCNGVTQSVELAPSSLTYFFVSTDTVGLRWQDNSPNEEEFVVEVATDSSFSSIITSAPFPQNTTEGYVGGLAESTQYWFRVYARNATAQTRYSNVVLAKTSSIYFENAVVIAAGGYHTCAIKTNGNLFCWGDNSAGQLGIGSSGGSVSTPTFITSSVTSVALGYAHTCAIKTNGDLYCWGYNGYGQLGDGTNVNKNIPTFITSSVTSVALGGYHTCAIKTNGNLFCWGYNGYGQLGDGTYTDKSTPTFITSSVTSVALGGYHTCAIKTNGDLFCWGYNYYGQLGDGTNVNKNIPTFITSSVTSVALGGYHTCAIKTNGNLFCWGYNGYGQLGDETTVDKSTPTRVLAGSGGGSSPAPRFYFKEFGKPAESISSDEPYGCSSYSLIYAPLLVLSLILMIIKKRKLKSKIAQKQ